MWSRDRRPDARRAGVAQDRLGPPMEHVRRFAGGPGTARVSVAPDSKDHEPRQKVVVKKK